MVTFLAEVTQVSRLGQKAKAILKGVRRSDGLWVSATNRTIDLPYNRTWHEKQLLLLELNKDGSVEEVTHASDRLFEALKEWNLRLARFDSDKVELELQKKSLEYQAAKLYAREQELRKAEELQRISEKSLEELKTLADEKLQAANKQHEALKGAWEHLNYREQQLKKG